MINTGENKVLQTKTCPSATSSTTNSTCTSMGSNLGFHCQGSSLITWDMAQSDYMLYVATQQFISFTYLHANNNHLKSSTTCHNV